MANDAAAGRQNTAKLLKCQERVFNVLEYFNSQRTVETPGVEAIEGVVAGPNEESQIIPANLFCYRRAIADPGFIYIHT